MTFNLPQEFVDQYKMKTPPWGFGGLGEIVYLRTYSRPKENGDLETWAETLQRVINGAIDIGVPYTQDEAERLFDYMFNLRCSFAGRSLWQLGTPLVKQMNGTSLNNCFHGDTEIITKNGVYPIGSLVGQTADVLTKDGWVNAPISSFGIQQIQEVTFRPAHRGARSQSWRRSRSSLRHSVQVTPNHRWFLVDESTTVNLKVGDIVKANINEDSRMSVMNTNAFVHGFVFGDGTIAYQRADGTMVHRVRLCGAKDQRWLETFLYDGWRRLGDAPNGDPTLVKDYMKSLKTFPVNPDADYASSFLDGWIAADGHKKPNSDISLCSQHPEAGEWLHKFAAISGYLLVGECIGAQNPSNYGQRTNELYRYTLTQRERAWAVESIVAQGDAEVFCATVPEVEAFTLANGIYTSNCYFKDIESIEDFEMLFEYLMLGGGVGFSVERSKIHDLPKVIQGVTITNERSNDADIIVPDSRQGWKRLLHAVLKSYFHTGRSFTYSTILIREYGAPLKTFGGSASGPGALIDGIKDICTVMQNREGKKLRSIDVLDICNIIGRIVVSGSSRRSAQIAIGDPDDVLFLRAKNWATGSVPAWRANSNNSIYADSYDEIQPELWKGYDGSGEPYGLINRKLLRSHGRLGEKNQDNSISGVNPCGEVGLSGLGESCNLSTIFLPNVDSLEQMHDISRLLYMAQKQITRLEYPYKKTTEIVRKNARLGQSVTGILQAGDEKLKWLDPVYVGLVAFDKEYSATHGYPRSIRLTTVQPSGTLSLLPGVTPGIHPAYAQYYIRRVRFGSSDPLVDACRKRGYKVQWDIGLDGREEHTRYVVDFPCVSPEGSVLAADMTAIQQLEWVKRMQTDWADNAVSVTVYYRKEELEDIKEWLSQNYDKSIKSVSFLLHADHNFLLPPYEEITEAQYHTLLGKIDTTIPLSQQKGSEIELDECASGACPVK